MNPTSTSTPYNGYALHTPKNLFHSFLFVVLLANASMLSANDNTKKMNTCSKAGSNYSPLGTTESLRTNLYLLNTTNNSTILADGVFTEYHNLYHDSVTLEDAYKFTNINENLGMNRYNKTLAVERRPIITVADTIYFNLWRTTQRYYQFEFIPTNLNHPGMEAMLLDSYLGISTPLSLTATTKVNFSINSSAASSNQFRFKIVYSTASASATLPVTFASIKGYQAGNKIKLDWKIESEINNARYEVEQSADGSTFNTLNVVPVKAVGNANNYSSEDESPVNGNNFYRIKSVDKDGSFKYSRVVKVTIGKKGNGNITIYPNPIKGNVINLQFINQLQGEYKIRMISNTGQTVYAGTLTINSNNISETIYANKYFQNGLYQLEIQKPDNTTEVKKAIVQQ